MVEFERFFITSHNFPNGEIMPQILLWHRFQRFGSGKNDLKLPQRSNSTIGRVSAVFFHNFPTFPDPLSGSILYFYIIFFIYINIYRRFFLNSACFIRYHFETIFLFIDNRVFGFRGGGRKSRGTFEQNGSNSTLA